MRKQAVRGWAVRADLRRERGDLGQVVQMTQEEQEGAGRMTQEEQEEAEQMAQAEQEAAGQKQADSDQEDTDREWAARAEKGSLAEDVPRTAWGRCAVSWGILRRICRSLSLLLCVLF